MQPIHVVTKHPELYKPYSGSTNTNDADSFYSDYIAFPDGQFKYLHEVIDAEPLLFDAMQNQYLEDISKLKRLSNDLIGGMYNEEIDEFYQKFINKNYPIEIRNGSLITFRVTRYQLHYIVARIDSFLRLEAKCSDQELESQGLTRDGICCLLHECLTGIDRCLPGSSSRIQSAFISLQSAAQCDIQEKLYQIRHGALEYAAKSFLAKEHARGNVHYPQANEVHWSNALFNQACHQFGLDSIKDENLTVVRNKKIISKFERSLPSLITERDIVHRLTEELYQQLRSVFTKHNKQEWLTRPFSESELSAEIISDINNVFINPLNLQLNQNEENKLTLSSIIDENDDGTFHLSNSREYFQVWLLNSLLAPYPKVFTVIDSQKTKHRLIGSMDDLYFWVFESANHHSQGSPCHFDWDNHQTLTIAHLKTVDFTTWPEDVCLNLVIHALQYTNKPDDFFEFFLNQKASAAWQKIEKSHPKLKHLLDERLISCMRSNENFAQITTERLQQQSLAHDQNSSQKFFMELFDLALTINHFDIVISLSQSKYCKRLNKHVCSKYHKMLHAAVICEESHRFEILIKHPQVDINSMDPKGCTLFMLAAQHGLIEHLKLLLAQKGIKTNLKNRDGFTAFTFAASGGHKDCIVWLLAQKGIKIDSKNNEGSTAFMLAAENGHIECVKLLLAQAEIKINRTNKKGLTAFMLAAKEGHAQCLQLLLAQKDIEPGQQRNDGSNALMLATNNGHTECVKTLLAQDSINVNHQNNEGATALMLAAAFGHIDCLEMLLAKDGIKINLQKHDGRTALMIATRHGNTDCLKTLLMQTEINTRLLSNKGWTPLMTAARYGYVDCLQMLINLDPNFINLQNNNGYTSLMMAVLGEDERCTTTLLQQPNIDINKKNTIGQTAFTLAHSRKLAQRPWQSCQKILDAAKSGNEELLAEQFNFARSLINVRNKDGYTPLMLAARNGHMNCLKTLLVQKEIKVNLRDKNGWTPLMAAARYGHEGCLQTLLDHDPDSVNLHTNNRYTALMLAVRGGHERCVKILLQQPNIDINIQTSTGLTALRLAASQEEWECFQLLADHDSAIIKTG